MDYLVSGLPLEPFAPLFRLEDAALRARGIQRLRADAGSGFPCRITLQDAAPGQPLLLLNWRHLSAGTPYRADGPIFVGEWATATAQVRNAIPPQQLARLLSVRAYDAEGWMRDAEVVEGTGLEALIARFFADPQIAFLHAHYARHGCYACRIDRG